MNKLIATASLRFLSFTTFSQVGIGTTSPSFSALLDVTSTSKGFLFPKMTLSQRDAIASPVEDLQVWCSNCGSVGELQVYNGSTWTNTAGGAASPLFVCGTSTVSFIYNGTSVTYGTVSKTYSGVTKCWLDRNLGATQVATSTTDVPSKGHYFQLGRGDDGHQLLDSNITSTRIVFGIASSDWVRGNTNPSNWLTVNNNTLWQGVNGINNPCPTGFRVPTKDELTAEISSWSPSGNTGAYNSTLKFPGTGFRRANESYYNIHWTTKVMLWSSTIGNSTTEAWDWDGENNVWYSNAFRNQGYMVRCNKN